MAHRLSWIGWHGDIEAIFCVLHRCDNPQCVNPFHLFIGTKQDNVDDMIQKNRKAYPCGEAAGGLHKLNTQQVIQIRELYSTGKYSQRKLGEIYNVSHIHIGYIVRREKWNHV